MYAALSLSPPTAEQMTVCYGFGCARRWRLDFCGGRPEEAPSPFPERTPMEPVGVVLAAVLGGLFVVLLLIAVSGAVRYIPNNRLGVLEKLWSTRGSVSEGFIAQAGEAGFQPEVLRGGYHFFMPFQYRVHRAPLVTIPQGQIGYMFARDGVALAPTQTLASTV